MSNTKSKTIKDANIEDLEYFNSIKSDGLNDSGAFSKLILEHRKKEGLYNDMMTENTRLIEETDKNKSELASALETIKELTLEIEELKARAPEVKEVEKEIQLKGLQFICEPTEEIYAAARKARPFIRKDEVFEFSSEDPLDYPNKLANHSIKYFLSNEYSHIEK